LHNIRVQRSEMISMLVCVSHRKGESKENDPWKPKFETDDVKDQKLQSKNVLQMKSKIVMELLVLFLNHLHSIVYLTKAKYSVK
jgi:hypothetical protein